MICEKFLEVLAVKGAVKGTGKLELAWGQGRDSVRFEDGRCGSISVNCFVSCQGGSWREGRAEAQSWGMGSRRGSRGLVRATMGGQAESRGTCLPCGFTRVMPGWSDLGDTSTNS